MKLLVLSAAYVIVHLAIYVLAIDKRRTQERAILLFHVGSFLVLVTVLGAIFIIQPSEGNFVGAVAGVALHAVYSLSFLELWALADGSLSLPILAHVAAQRSLTRAEILERYKGISDKKKAFRLDTLLTLRLVRRDGVEYSLTARGRWVARAFSALAFSAGLRERG